MDDCDVTYHVDEGFRVFRVMPNGSLKPVATEEAVGVLRRLKKRRDNNDEYHARQQRYFRPRGQELEDE